jgi:RNase P subunit RPR2
MNCWHCKTALIWGNDHDINPTDHRGDEFSMVTILACPKCDSMVEVFYPIKETDNDN